MGLYKGRLMSLLLAALVGVGFVACDDEDADAEAEEQADEPEAQLDIDEEELPFYATGPVARIDGEEIGKDDFNAMVQERVERLPGELPPQMAEMFKQQSVDFVIDKHLVDEVLAGEDIEVTDEDIDEAFAEFKDRFGGDEQMFQAQLDQMGMSEEELRENMHQDVELEKYLATQHDLDVSDEDIEEFFEQNKDQFVEEEQVQASHILIELDDDADDDTAADARERADEVYAMATEDGADFAELAEEKSEGPTAAQGGDLGFFPRHQMVEEFSDVAFDELEVGDISEPVRSQFGYHVIKKVDHQEGGEAELDDVRDDIEMQLTHQKRQEAFQTFLEELKADVEIEELRDNIVMNVEAPEQQPQPMMPGGQGEGQPQPVQPPAPEGGDQELELELGGEEDGDAPELELDLEE